MFRIYRKKTTVVPEALPSSDLWMLRIVVITLSVTVVSCVAGAVWLQVQGKPTPELLTVLGTGSVGGLAVVLRPSQPD